MAVSGAGTVYSHNAAAAVAMLLQFYMMQWSMLVHYVHHHIINIIYYYIFIIIIIIIECIMYKSTLRAILPHAALCQSFITKLHCKNINHVRWGMGASAPKHFFQRLSTTLATACFITTRPVHYSQYLFIFPQLMPPFHPTTDQVLQSLPFLHHSQSLFPILHPVPSSSQLCHHPPAPLTILSYTASLAFIVHKFPSHF